ncbi:DUF5518 domain-containing protein [Salinirussus salinus]|jgi:hypothetical protein|uniref:DUF5518 domain-containing protein n=1 Tax=Salinirussus salinus TaxID=1198300 RepID=UPI001F3D79D0|nr:DUF5518 domain-containing protein [Salinirussus salinus]
MSSSTESQPVRRGEAGGPRLLDGAVTWLVSLLLVLGGLAFAFAGTLFTQVASGSWVARMVAEGRLQSTELTAAELTDVTNALLWWGGAGLVVVGLAMVVAGVGFLVVRRRTRAARGDGSPDTVTSAVVGAVVTVLTAFVPLSPVLGGAAAAYLRKGDRETALRVGALAGLVAAVPVVVLFAFLVGGFAVVASELALGAVTGIVVLALVFSLFVAVLYTVGLSALGGYLASGLAGPAADDEHGQQPAT